MKQLTCYLAHPYSTMEWGFKFTKSLEAIGISVIDPFNRPGQEELNKVEEQNRNSRNKVTGNVEFSPTQNREIVEIDMIKVRQADILIALVNGDDSKGTHMEFMGAAFFMHMPCFTLYTQKGRIHPWYGYLSRGVARTEDELLVQLKEFMAQPVAHDWYL
jgi:nucleoside 2-deoxyribosyltransferase